MRTLNWLVVALLASGCANFGAVRRFARESAECLASEEVRADALSGPLRRSWASPPSALPALREDDTRAQKQDERWRALQRILAAYFEALAELASDQDVDVEVERLAKVLSKVTDADESTMKAGVTLAQLLTRAIADGYRAAELKKLVSEAAPALQQTIASLRQSLRGNAQLLATEQTTLELVFLPLRARPLKLDGDRVCTVEDDFVVLTGTATEENLTRDQARTEGMARLLLAERVATLHERCRRLALHDEALATIATGHAALVKNIDLLDKKDLFAQARPWLERLIELNDALRSLSED